MIPSMKLVRQKYETCTSCTNVKFSELIHLSEFVRGMCHVADFPELVQQAWRLEQEDLLDKAEHHNAVLCEKDKKNFVLEQRCKNLQVCLCCVCVCLQVHDS